MLATLNSQAAGLCRHCYAAVCESGFSPSLRGHAQYDDRTVLREVMTNIDNIIVRVTTLIPYIVHCCTYVHLAPYTIRYIL